jgi:RHS repeat-associated protein
VVEGTTVVESYDYDPWGVLMPGRTKGSGTKEGFTGKERDSESGLDYFGARHYMAALGRCPLCL